MSVVASGNDLGPVVAALRQSRFCEGLGPEELELVALRVRPVACEAGESICRVGMPGDSMFVVAKGRLRVTVPERGGGERVLAYLCRGDYFGELALLGEGKRAANVTALFDSELLTLDRAAFHQLFDEVPQVGKNIIRTLGFRLTETLLGQRHPVRPKIVGIVRSNRRGRMLCDLLLGRLAERGERITLLGDREGQSAPCPVEAIPHDQGTPGSALAERLRQLVERGDRVVLEAMPDESPRSLHRLLRRCDDVLWLVEPGHEGPSPEAFQAVRADPGLAARTHVVWILPEGQQVAPRWHSTWDLDTRDFKVELAERPATRPRRQEQAIDRLVRHLRGISTGLALGGGGARGLAHLGVFRALDRAGISFDLMAGASSGAMMGIGYASGYDPEFARERFAKTLTPPAIFRWLPAGSRWYLQAMFRTGAWDHKLRPYLHDWTLEQLPVPFSAVTVDLVTGSQVVRERGDAIHALLESINIPVVSAPIRRDGMALVDGGVLNNLPADVLTKKGADFVVGVNVTAGLAHEFAGNRPDMATAQMKAAGWMETVLRVFETQGHELTAMRARSVDLMIEPEAARFPFTDFTRADELADVGEAAAEAALPHLKTLLAELEQESKAEG
jgi:predicted acylesterase/phospholipase RssA